MDWSNAILPSNEMNGYLGYPHKPGFKVQKTSRQAAEEITSKAKTLQKKILELLVNLPAGATPDQIAEYLEESILSIRPRMSELKAQGKIKDSGLRGKTAFGKSSIIWQTI